jgi:hypothetical protein
VPPNDPIIPPRVTIQSRRQAQLSSVPSDPDPENFDPENPDQENLDQENLDRESLDPGGDLQPEQLSPELGKTLKDIAPDP